MYVNGVAVGSKPIPAWSMPTPLPAGSLYCEIGMDNSLLVPNSSPTETAGHAVTSPDNTTPIIEAQEAIDRAASTLSVDDVLNVPYHSTLLVSSALVFDGELASALFRVLSLVFDGELASALFRVLSLVRLFWLRIILFLEGFHSGST